MSYPILYESNATDFFNLGLGTLPDAISTLVTEERNGEFILEMSYPIDGTRADLIKNNCIIKADAGHLLKDQRFVVKTVTPHMESNGQTTIQVYAEHISYLANDLTLKPSVSVADMDAQAALNQWKKNIIDPNNFTVDSDISTKTSTTWTIDKVQNARQALGGVEGSILDRWKGEYRFDNLHISLLKARGTTANTLLAYGRNITDFQQEENIINTYTSIYPYATLSSATGDDQLMYTLDDYVVDSEYVGNYPNRKTEPIDFGSEFENVKVGTKPSGDKAEKDTTYLSIQQVQDKLKTLAQQYIKNNNVGIPTVSIKISFVDLSRTTNYADVAPLEQLDLCDNVSVRFSKHKINTTAKVSRVVWNVLTDSYDSLELGEISATLGDKLNQISDNTDHAKNEVDKWKNIVQTAANGINTVFRGPDTPVANHINDLWYKPNGQDTEMYQWNGVTWVFIMSTKETSELKDLVDQAMQDIDDAAAKANQAITDAGFATDTANTAKEVADSVKEDVATAKSDSATALTNANTALDNAKTAQSTADTIKVDVDDVKGQLTSKADKTDIDAVTKRVATNETNIIQNSTDIETKASQADVNTLTGRVTSAESSIIQNANNIKSKVSSSDVQGMLDNGGYATQTWTGSQIDQKADEINSTVTSVSNKVDQKGNTNKFVVSTIVSGYHQNSDGTLIPTNNDASSDYIATNGNTQFTWTAFDKQWDSTDTDSHWNMWDSNKNYIAGSVNLKSGLNTISKSNVAYITLSINYFLQGGTSTKYVDWFNSNRYKLEFGNKATDWSPAPEDTATVTALSKVEQKADSISSTVTNNKSDADNKFTNINQTISGIQSTVASKADASQITQLSNQINLKVSQTDFDNMQVGGRNYVTNGNFADGTNGWTKFGNIDTYQIWGDGRLVYSSTKAINGYTGAGQNNIPISGSKGDNTTVSFDACYFGDNPSNYAKYINIIVHYNDNSGTIVSQSKNSIDMTSSVQRYSFTIKAPTDFSTVNVRFVYDSNTLYRNKLGRVKIEKGTKATDYSDSPDDKADKANLVSQINIDESGVLISGDKIMIDGDTYIKNGVIKSAMIDTLDASKVTTGTLDAANVNIINLNVSKLVGNTTDFVKSAWNSIDKYVYISGDGMQIVGDWGANVYDDWGIRSYAYNASNNLELVGNFSSTYAVGDKNINGTLVSADYEGDFVGIGYRDKVGDNFTPMVGYFKKDQTALGWYQGTNIVGHLILHDYIKPLGGTADYIQIGSIKFNNINYAYVGNSSGKAGFAYGTGYVYLISQGTSFRMGGWKIPVDITSDGKVKSWISLPGSYN